MDTHSRVAGLLTSAPGSSEPRVVVAHREHLWWLLAEALQLKHSAPTCMPDTAHRQLGKGRGRKYPDHYLRRRGRMIAGDR